MKSVQVWVIEKSYNCALAHCSCKNTDRHVTNVVTVKIIFDKNLILMLWLPWHQFAIELDVWSWLLASFKVRNFVIHCWMENIQKILKCEMWNVKCKWILFVLLKIQGQMHQAAASLETIQVLALLSQRCITHAHCARYNLQIFNNYPAQSRGISSDT